MATFSAAVGVDPAWNEWFKLNLRCSQSVACTLFQLASSDGYRETAAAMGVSKVCDPIIPTGGTTAKDKHHSIFKLCVIIEKTSCHLTFTQDPGATVIFGSIRSLTTAS
ncbi:hypothetical protein PC114_g13676 [Phytophthora cactorum]|uniref:Uncharacterized protein n=1 Tax=Phytophthora cactorum TaxID=29920 RepID=A0A8T1CF87_9STRA|nr:hypothetical protein PC114_g13676 [Phytophthora cactorum]KAG2918283.1 hypothetical protein PC115_g10487 [Phytophthora cactorum]